MASCAAQRAPVSTPRPQEAEELAVSSPLGVTSVVINCLQGLIKKFCCASLPVLFDPLQFAYRPNGTPGDALAHLDTLDICVDAVRGLQLCSQHPGSSQAGPVLELCLQVPTRLATGVPGHSLLQHHCEVLDGLGNTWERASLEEADKLSPWCRDKNLKEVSLHASQDLQDPCGESQHLQVPGGPNPSP